MTGFDSSTDIGDRRFTSAHDQRLASGGKSATQFGQHLYREGSPWIVVAKVFLIGTSSSLKSRV
jgi:hypothetical protein